VLFRDSRPIDLTLTIDERYPTTWPAHVPFVRRTWNYFEEQTHGPEAWASCGPYFTEVLIMDEHIATHFDAPSHFLPKHAPGEEGAVVGDLVPLDQFVGNAVCIDVTGLAGSEPGESPWIEPEHIEMFERGRGGRALTAEDVVLFRSDWDQKHYHPFPRGKGYAFDVAVTKTSPGWPAPSVQTIRLLLDRGVRCVGTDAPSMGAAHDGIPAHVEGLSNGQVFIEGLANLKDVPPDHGTFQFMPVKIARSSGGPGRAVVWIPNA
jgi:kynurenine formamidase